MLYHGRWCVSDWHRFLHPGGDAAALKGIMKTLIGWDNERGDILDHDFIAEHTLGFEAVVEDLKQTSWQDIESESGLSQADIESVALLYANSPTTIITYGMGITQHNKGTANVRLIADLLLMKGNIGKPGLLCNRNFYYGKAARRVALPQS